MKSSELKARIENEWLEHKNISVNVLIDALEKEIHFLRDRLERLEFLQDVSTKGTQMKEIEELTLEDKLIGLITSTSTLVLNLAKELRKMREENESLQNTIACLEKILEDAQMENS